MGKKMLPLICILFLCMILAGTGKAEATTSKAKVEVIFENGLNEINKVPGDNFIASIKVTLPEGVVIDFWDMEIHWNTTTLELQHGTADDVTEGPFMLPFGSTDFGLQDPDNVNGILPDISNGFKSGAGNAAGSGILCYIAFHCKAAGDGWIDIYGYPDESYLLDQVGSEYVLVEMDTPVNGVVIPEFPAYILLPLFLLVTTTAVIAAAVWSRKRRIHLNIP
jgi:hypothetical protein